MLLEFRVANFRSFAEEQVFSFVADKDTTLIENTIECAQSPTGRVIRLAVLYGPNGGGKSALVRAVEVMRRLVVDSARWQEGDRLLGVERFKLDPALRGAPSRFELTFVADWQDPDDPQTTRPVRYQYGFSADAERVHEEWLLAYPHGQPQTWFDRSAEGFEFGRHLKGEKKRIGDATRTNALFLSVAAQQNQQQLQPVFRWIRNGLGVLGIEALPIPGQQTSGRMPLSSNGTTRILAAEDGAADQREAVVDMLRHADVGIEGIRVDPGSFIAGVPDSLREAFGETLATLLPPEEVFTLHRGRDGELIEWSLQDESEGTQHLYALLGPWIDALISGQAVFFDELFSNLHPGLATHLIRDYFDSRVSGGMPRSQIVLTTHDTNLLDAKLLRRDQIWFVEKNPDGASRLYALLEYRPRKDENFEKGYLAGRYGALPFVGEMKF